LDQNLLTEEQRMRFAQIRDRVSNEEPPAPIDVSGLPGLWVNSNPESSGIVRMLITESGGSLLLRVNAIGPEGLIDWGTAELTVFTSTPSSRVATGFTCVYDFGFAETRLQAMIMKGLVVLAQIHNFKDGSNRAGYFVREYYALEHGRYQAQAS
jgi:hypothetical protein